MKYIAICFDCQREDGGHASEEAAEQEALRHYAEDHGYAIQATYDDGTYAYERK